MKNLLSRTEYVLRETKSKFNNVAVLWSGGKDSTALLYVIAETFSNFPFIVVHLDNGNEFPETYAYMEKVQKNLNFKLIREPIEIKQDAITGLKCCGNNKTEALKRAIKREHFDAVVVGIRWDEHGIRGMERSFSPRDKEFKWNVYDAENGKFGNPLQDPEFVDWGITVNDFGKKCDHVRIHPLLHWSEADIWRYLENNNIPINNLYFSKNGKRMRSIGCQSCSVTIPSPAVTTEEIIQEITATTYGERAGRVQDKEMGMERLRAIGYM